MNNDLKFNLGSVINKDVMKAVGKESYIDRVLSKEIDFETYLFLVDTVESVDVSDRFVDVIKTFDVRKGITPAGFRIEFTVEEGDKLVIDLVRDISYGENGLKRPTNVIFSADSANPYEIEPIKNLIGNLTCNPGIIYDLFINNPKANIGGKFKTRDEVMMEIGRILGPGCDISVELNNPYAPIEELLIEAAHFKEMLSEYRVVIKVPHTGPMNNETIGQLLVGDKTFESRYNAGKTEDFLRGHNVALRLQEEGYRVNFTLMFEPYQAALALQAKPYFINSFVRHRLIQSNNIQAYLGAYEASKNTNYLVQLRDYLVKNDHFAPSQKETDLMSVKDYAENLIKYRQFEGEGADGLDSVRHNLRVLKQCNLPDTRLIVCSMEGPNNYPDLDRLLTEEEFKDMIGKVVITAEPNYLAQFTSTNQVVTYQRRFMNAANGQK
jgi:hypothetical protein